MIPQMEIPVKFSKQTECLLLDHWGYFKRLIIFVFYVKSKSQAAIPHTSLQ